MNLSPARVRVALIALALGGFGIGATEFAAMGLLPDLARDLLPDLYAASPEAANAQAGWAISAYALGVVVGAPTIAALVARYPRKAVLLWLAAAFTIGTIASALMPTFGLVLAARFIAGLPHGAYFGIATLVAASLVGPERRAQGVSFVLFGLTIANVVGVPLVTLLGQSAGWRVSYFIIAALFALTFVAVWVAVPRQPGDPGATLRREVLAFRRPLVWMALATGAIGFGGFFAVYSYVAPIVTDITGLGVSAVPLMLVIVGVGMTVGNFVGGRAADRHVMRAVFMFFGVLAVALLGLALTAQFVAGVAGFLFILGFASSALAPAIQTRLMDVAGDSQTLAAAGNHAALNIGNGMGAWLGGLTIAAGFGYLAPAWVGLVLCAAGAILGVVGVLVGRRPIAVATAASRRRA